MKWFVFFILLSSVFGAESSWMKVQIKEDLASVARRSIVKRDLYSYFQELDRTGGQALYGRLYKNRVEWESTLRSDSYRNSHIFRYFKSLLGQFSLPDLEFILLTDDGCVSSPPVPVFSFSRYGKAQNVLLFPDFEMLKECLSSKKNWSVQCGDFAKRHPWKTKRAQAFFRGASTGCYDSSLPDFGNDRVRAILFSAQYPDLLDATFSAAFQEPIQDLLFSLGKSLEGASIQRHFEYKYLLDIDGNASTYSRGRWILLSNSVLVKVMSPFCQWYYKALQPWVHYVPIRQDLSDLSDILEILRRRDGLARKIAKNGQMLGEEIFAKAAVDGYVAALLRKYEQKLK